MSTVWAGQVFQPEYHYNLHILPGRLSTRNGSLSMRGLPIVYVFQYLHKLSLRDVSFRFGAVNVAELLCTVWNRSL